MRAARACGVAALAAGAAGHGYLVDPPPRTVGPTKTTKGVQVSKPGVYEGIAGSCASGLCFWFSQGCRINGKACDGKDGTGSGRSTLPAGAGTGFGCMKGYPWCAPGSAPVVDPCGVAGGWGTPGVPGSGGHSVPGHPQGEHGSTLPMLPGVKPREWKVGEVVDIQWSMVANHGGGYQYRLCPKDKAGAAGAETECFQKHVMEFHGDTQFIQYCYSDAVFPPYLTEKTFGPCTGNRVEIPDFKVSTGTKPAGSVWRRNPIPACKASAGGAFAAKCGPGDGTRPGDFMFPPAGPDESRAASKQLLGGFGAGACYGSATSNCGVSHAKIAQHTFTFNIVDAVVVPDVPPGDYVMSFRWDCEQSSQVWNSCTDVTITSGGPAPPAPPPTPATKYTCKANKCTAAATGLDLPTCQSACGSLSLRH